MFPSAFNLLLNPSHGSENIAIITLVKQAVICFKNSSVTQKLCPSNFRPPIFKFSKFNSELISAWNLTSNPIQNSAKCARISSAVLLPFFRHQTKPPSAWPPSITKPPDPIHAVKIDPNSMFADLPFEKDYLSSKIFFHLAVERKIFCRQNIFSYNPPANFSHHLHG